VIDILNHSFSTFVGEDIELFNRLLSQHSKHNSRRSDVPLLNKAYQLLGCVVHSGMEFTHDLLEEKKFLKGNRRYTLTEDSKEIGIVRAFLEKLYTDFKSGDFKHYFIPRKAVKTPDSKLGKGLQLPIDERNWRSMLLTSTNTEVAVEEEKHRELINVRVLSNLDWKDILQTHFDSLLTRNWKFKEKLSGDTIDYFEDNFLHYLGADSPERRNEVKRMRKKRKR
jgi:hypothetical protein